MIETSLDCPQKSLAIFGYLGKSSVIFENFQKMFGNIHITIWTSFGESSENYLRKIIKNVTISMSM